MRSGMISQAQMYALNVWFEVTFTFFFLLLLAHGLCYWMLPIRVVHAYTQTNTPSGLPFNAANRKQYGDAKQYAQLKQWPKDQHYCNYLCCCCCHWRHCRCCNRLWFLRSSCKTKHLRQNTYLINRINVFVSVAIMPPFQMKYNHWLCVFVFQLEKNHGLCLHCAMEKKWGFFLLPTECDLN